MILGCLNFGFLTLSDIIGAIWAHIGPIWAHIGPIWAHMGPIWAHMGPIWAHTGPHGPGPLLIQRAWARAQAPPDDLNIFAKNVFLKN